MHQETNQAKLDDNDICKIQQKKMSTLLLFITKLTQYSLCL